MRRKSRSERRMNAAKPATGSLPVMVYYHGGGNRRAIQ
jgi:hypothetical protein